ncbi:cupin domain-containing protein [candidate division WOR-3 bacterium]|nr:cupin domain-containing protein [candidate division WOR-3 bacterium]
MKIVHAQDVPSEASSLAGTKRTTLRWLIAAKDGAPHYAMRLFEIEPGGAIPVHTHGDIEHEIFIVEGEAICNDGKNESKVKTGDALLVLPGDQHSFKNTTDHMFRFICVIPI